MKRKPDVLTDMKGEGLEFVPEEVRRATAVVMMWIGWIGFWGLFTYAVLSFNPAEGRFAPQWVTYSFFASLFLAIIGTMLRSRMRLQNTIIEAFKAGVEAAELARLAAFEDMHEKLDEKLTPRKVIPVQDSEIPDNTRKPEVDGG